MTDEQAKTHPTIECWVFKFCLTAGHIFKVKAWELGPTGRIKVADGDLKNLEFEQDDWDALEWLAMKKARDKRDAAIAGKEKDLERLRKLSFDGDTVPEQDAAE